MRSEAEQAVQGEFWRDDHARIQVFFPISGHQCINRKTNRGKVGLLAALDEIPTHPSIFVDIKLKAFGSGCGAAYLLNTGRRQGRQTVHRAMLVGRPGDSKFSFMMEQPRHCSR